MEQTSTFQPNPTQLKLFELARHPETENLLLYGGSRGGKSAGICALILERALLYPRTRHAIFRLTLTSCNRQLGPARGTFPEVLDKILPGYLQRSDVNVAKSDGLIELHNGSTIIFEGLDPTRIDKVLGAQYATAWVNECNEVSDYDIIQQLASRMNDTAQLEVGGKKQTDKTGKPVMLRPLMIFDCNPRFKSDWEYSAFVLHCNPLNGKAHKRPDAWKKLKINPLDNAANQAEGYVEKLTERYDGSPKMMARFVEGEWSEDNPNAMFRSDMIERASITKDECIRILVAVDPAVSTNKNSDETGMVVVGLGLDGRGYVLDDLSGKMTPEQWAKRAVEAYDHWDADCIIAEKNNGGLMVEQVIREQRRNVPVKLVHASKGKAARAEPISMLYAKHLINHVEMFKELEGQMFDFGMPGNTKSPDRVDALVWGLTELFKLGGEDRSFKQSKARGFY